MILESKKKVQILFLIEQYESLFNMENMCIVAVSQTGNI